MEVTVEVVAEVDETTPAVTGALAAHKSPTPTTQ